MKAWRFLKEMLDKGVPAEIFVHARNWSVAVLIFAAGVYAVGRDALNPEPGFMGILPLGIGVAVLGGLLMVLNLVDGLYRLSKAKYRLSLSLLLAVFYIFISLRIAQILIDFRSH